MKEHDEDFTDYTCPSCGEVVDRLIDTDNGYGCEFCTSKCLTCEGNNMHLNSLTVTIGKEIWCLDCADDEIKRLNKEMVNKMALLEQVSNLIHHIKGEAKWIKEQRDARNSFLVKRKEDAESNIVTMKTKVDMLIVAAEKCVAR